MHIVQAANLALRFVLELVALVAFGYGGFVTGDGPWKWALGIGLPVVVAIVWGAFVAPRARVELPTAVKLVLGLIILELAAVALAAAGRPALAVVFALVVLLNAALIVVWHQEPTISRSQSQVR